MLGVSQHRQGTWLVLPPLQPAESLPGLRFSIPFQDYKEKLHVVLKGSS